jgi:4Fe-4S ferredoxin
MTSLEESNSAGTAQGAECKQKPGAFRPVVDRNACEGKGECVRVCPVAVFAVGTLPKEERRGLGLKGRLKGFAHRWQQALLINPDACQACGLCVEACPEKALTLERA